MTDNLRTMYEAMGDFMDCGTAVLRTAIVDGEISVRRVSPKEWKLP